MESRRRQSLEIVTVGIPFCAFKVLTGMTLVGRPWLGLLGGSLIALGALDLAVNLTNLAALAAGRPPVFGVCLLEIAARRWRPARREWHDVGVSADVMLSFALVAVVIGAGLLPALPPLALRAWSVAVVLNVLGAGFGRLSSSVASLREGPRRD